MTYNLKPLYPTCSDLITNDKSLVTIYGRRPSDGALVPINVDDSGSLVIGTPIIIEVLPPTPIVQIQGATLGDNLDVIQIGDPISLPPYNGSSVDYRGLLVLGRNTSGNAQPFEFDASGNLLVSNLDVPLSTLETTLTAIKADLDEIVGASTSETFVYGEQLAVASGSTVTLVSYTVPAGQTFYLHRVEASGDTVGLYVVADSISTVCKRRSSYAVYNVDFGISTGIPFSAGDVLTLVVTNEGSASADFNGTIYGKLV